MNLRLSTTRAFTLIELLVAAALTVVVVGLALGALHVAQRSAERIQGRLEAAAAGQEVCDRLAQDLHALRCGAPDGGWLAVSLQRTANAAHGWIGGAKPTEASWNPLAVNFADARFGVGGAWLRFFTVRPGVDPRTSDSAAPVAVGYQVVRRALTADGADFRYCLYRSEAAASATRAAGFDLDAAAYASVSDIEGDVGNLILPPPAYVLAEDMVDFGVRLYATEADAANGLALFPSETTAEEFRGRAVDGPAAERIPRVVEVMVRVLTRAGARELAALEQGKSAGDWWAVVRANSVVVTRRIRIAIDVP